MRHWPATLVTALSLAACAAPAAPPVVPASPTPAPAASVAVPASPTPTPSPSATVAPSPSPSPTPTASPSGGLDEAQHGTTPFPAAPVAGAYELTTAKATAGAGTTTAVGAIDNRPYTQWAARRGTGQDTWLMVDLGEVRRVSRIALLPDASPKTEVSFDVEVSADKSSWKTVARSVLATGSNDTPKWGSASFTAESARYVRFIPTRWGTSWVAVWEVKIYP